jgi:serine/threonine-protein kinase
MPFAQQLGRYQLLDRIAFGGMAEIFRAKTFDADGRAHLVAVKRVLNHLCEDEDFLRMLVDEARLTASLEHDNIARVYEFAHEGDEYFIAMEYVDGKDVRSLVERQRTFGTPVPPEHVAYIAMHVANALQAAHTQRDAAGQPLQIVHRDVSPSNVLLSYRGEVKLCDFGIAKATTTSVHTKTGIIKGKIRYMSPEQAMGKKLDYRSDLFSLGSIMFEMLTLTPPFVAATEVELIFAVRDSRRQDAREIEPSLPEELNAILNRAMSKSRAERYQSGAELARDLRQFLEGYRPGYKRGQFGRYMRQLFAAEIERELRLLEEYIIQAADPTKVGENLIADALGDHAVYAQFTAAATGPRAPTGSYAGGDSRPHSDLHSEPTLIFKPTLRPARPSFHEQETQLKELPAKAEPPDPGEPTTADWPKLHDLDTQILDRPQKLVGELTGDLGGGRGYEEPEETALPGVAERPRRDTAPDVAPQEEPTAVPMGDEEG